MIEQGYAGVQNMDISNFSFNDILHEVNLPVTNKVASAPPYIMPAVEQNFANEFRTIATDLANEMDNMGLNENDPNNERQSRNPQDTNPFQPPVVQLYKANSEGNRAQFDILPEEFNPKSSRLPYPYMGTFGREDLDLESTGEMLLKVSLTNIISKDPNIDTDRFINYLNEFYYRSQSINQEYLNRIKYKKLIFPAEALTTLENFC